MLRCSKVLEFVQNNAPKVFDATHLGDDTLATSRNAHTVLIFCAAGTTKQTQTG